MKDSTLFHLHIPKTGGTTAFKVLENIFGQKLIQVDPMKLLILRKYVSAKDAVFSGHVPLFIIENFDKIDTIFTIIRDPESRLLSFVNHVLLHNDHYANLLLERRLQCVTDFINNQHIMVESSNLQVRMLGGLEGSLPFTSKSNPFECYYRAIGKWNDLKITGNHLDKAKEALESRLEFGIFEYLDYSLENMVLKRSKKKQLEDKVKDFEIPHLNKPEKVLVAMDSLKQKIGDINRFDKELYIFAKELFLNRVAEDNAIGRELLYFSGAPEKFVGLYSLETSNGELLRWTTGYARLSILVPSKKAEYKISVLLWRIDNRSARLRSVEICGLTVDKSTDVGEFKQFEAIVTPELGADNRRKIEILIKASPARLGNDIRELGVALRSIVVSKLSRNA